MNRRAQVTVQQLVLVASVVVLASAVYFVSRSLVSTSRVSLDVEQAKSFEIISESLEGRGEVEASPALWADSRKTYRSRIVLRNLHDRAVQDVVVLTGDYVGEGALKGTINVRYLDEETGKYVDAPLAEFSRSDGCNYTSKDLVAFPVELDAGEQKTYEIYSNLEYGENESCTELKHDNIYAYTSVDGQTKIKLGGKIGFFYVGEGQVEGKGIVSVLGEECDLDSATCGLAEAKAPTLVDLEGEANLEETGNLVFVEGQAFRDHMALYFWVSGCRDRFKIRIHNFDPVQKVLRILESDGSPAKSSSKEYGSYTLSANEVLEDVLLINSPGVWSIDLPEGVAVTSEDIHINFALDPDSLGRVVDSEGNLLTDSKWEYDEYGNLVTDCFWLEGFEHAKKKPDVSAPRFNASYGDHLFPAFYPKKPTSNDNVKIFVLAWDSNKNIDPEVKGSIRNCSARIGRVVHPMLAVDYPGTGENPTQVANSSFDTNTEVAVVSFGRLGPGEYEVSVSCEDLYRNINTTVFVLNVSFSPFDVSGPEFRIVDTVLGKKIRIDPRKKTSASNLTFTVNAYDSSSPIKSCLLSVYNPGEFFYRDEEMLPLPGLSYKEEHDIVAEFTTPKPFALGEYSAEVVCEDTEGLLGKVLEEFEVGDGIAPEIRNVSFSVSGQAFGKELSQFLDPWTKVGFEVAASDDVQIKGCSVLYQTDPLRRLMDHQPQELVCKSGCGTKSSVFGFENSDWPRGGDYKVRFVCEDTSGNTVEKEVLVSIMDASSPVVEDFSFSPEKPGNNDRIFFSANVSDDVAVTVCNLTLANSSGGEKGSYSVYAGSEGMVPLGEGYGRVRVVFNVNKLADDEYGLNLTCDDESTDNIPNVFRQKFFVDTYGPLFSNLSLDQSVGRVSVNAFDALSGVSNCSFALGTFSGNLTQSLEEKQGGVFSSQTVLGSEVDLTVFCFDNYGRKSRYTYQSIRVPKVEFPKAEWGGQYTNNETLEFRAEPVVKSAGGPEIVVEECLGSLFQPGGEVLFSQEPMILGRGFYYEYNNSGGASNSVGATVACRDSTGFSFTQTGYATVLDVIPPTVSNVSVEPIVELRTDNRTLFFKVSVSDKGEGVKKCEAVIDPRGDPKIDNFRYPLVPQQTYAGNSYLVYGGHDYSSSKDPFPPETMSQVIHGEYSLYSGPFYGGNYTIRVTCWDNAGRVPGSGEIDNPALSETAYFGIKDTTPPVIYAMTETSTSSYPIDILMSNTTQWADSQSITFSVLAVDEATDVECFINMTPDATGYPNWHWTKMKRKSGENVFYLEKNPPGKLCLGRGHEIELAGLVPAALADDDEKTVQTLTSTASSLSYTILPVSTTVSGTATKTSFVNSAYNLLVEYRSGYNCTNPGGCAESQTCGCLYSPSRSNVYAKRADIRDLENMLVLSAGQAGDTLSDSSKIPALMPSGEQLVSLPFFGKVGEVRFDASFSTYNFSSNPSATHTFTQGGYPGVVEIKAYHDPAYRTVKIRCADNVGFGESNTQSVMRDINISRTAMHEVYLGVGKKYLPYLLEMDSETVTGQTGVVMVTTREEPIKNCDLKVGPKTLTDWFSDANITSLSTKGPPYLAAKALKVTDFVPSTAVHPDGNYTISVKCEDNVTCGAYPSTWIIVDSTKPNLHPIHLETVEQIPITPPFVYADSATLVLNIDTSADTGSGLDECFVSYAMKGSSTFPNMGSVTLDMGSGSGFFTMSHMDTDVTAAAASYVCFDKAGNTAISFTDYHLSCDPFDAWMAVSQLMGDHLTATAQMKYDYTGSSFFPWAVLAGTIAVGGLAVALVTMAGIIATVGWIPYVGWVIAIGAAIVALALVIMSLDCQKTQTSPTMYI